MSIRFKAAVLRQPSLPRPYTDSLPLQIEEIESAPPAEGEVLVRIKAASLCHSDLSVVSGVRAWPLPIVPGHEASGEIVEVNGTVKSVKPGDHVALAFQPGCGVCPDCVSGDVHLCGPGLAANRSGGLLAGGVRLHQGAQEIHHHMGVSAFAEYAVVSEHSIVRIPKSIPFEIGALFGCAVMCGAGIVLHTGHVSKGDSVTIIGLGGVGLSAILGAKLAGAGQIIAVDLDQNKLNYAKELGATDLVLNDTNQAAEHIVEITNGVYNSHVLEVGAVGFLDQYELAVLHCR